MRCALLAIAVLLARPAAAQEGVLAAQDKEMVGEWLITKSTKDRGTCLASAMSGETVLALVLASDGHPPMVMADNPQWPATNGKNFAGELALSGGERRSTTFVGTGAASGVPTIGATLPAALREPLKTSKSLEIEVADLKLAASFKITDAAKLWPALERCVKNSAD
jgi:hypothetical protein